MIATKPIIDAHKRATEIANRMVPGDWELNTPDHEAWLKAYDKAFAAEYGIGDPF